MTSRTTNGADAGTSPAKDSRSAERKSTLLFETTSKEKVYRFSDSILVSLPQGRKTLTTSWLNGGYREDVRAVFNHMIPKGKHAPKELEGGSVPAYLRIIAERIGTDPDTSSGLLTAANMDNVAIVTKSFRGVEVTAIMTAGIEVNGGRAGDPASYYQEGGSHQFIQGTINLILVIGADMPEYAMTRSIITASEAKAAALQQLMAPSRYSNSIATGSGTDMIAVVCDGTSSLTLTDAGQHSKLGELIGKAVIECTHKALELQSDLSPLSQRDMLVRLERFGISEADYWKVASGLNGANRKAAFLKVLREMSKNPVLVGATGTILHIVDEISWGLIPETAGRRVAVSVMKSLPGMLGMDDFVPFDELTDEKDLIVDNWVRVTAWMAKNCDHKGLCLQVPQD
ncbi:MAG: adenosylcobinamide hydrolase [Methanolobus sp.]|uniref:adenosylcobinamide amidohydrolase n=1 Tax=Methanolobus sp. TaxID=1874737 RepID=UPI0024AC5674|nr:adenosylcobinamide amidohydrolase [Methanolobus sp.]MDI3485753.1 adenosylcobinamide hydrolase [Methanolobus sp.]MDK2832028.1 adenosylcobinamide hydrolase [Methanolobus sp.]MDK2937978.1 adenosylcobinamide hydrolase [Methanolobus sp.]